MRVRLSSRPAAMSLLLAIALCLAISPVVRAQDDAPPAVDVPSGAFPAPGETADWLREPEQSSDLPNNNATGVLGTLARVTEGRVQLETGYAYLFDKNDTDQLSQHTFPDMLLRLGLTDRLELRLGWPGMIYSDFRDRETDTVTSSNDEGVAPNVGGMLDLWPQSGWIPQTAFLAAVPISLEGNPFALQSLQPLSSVLYSWSLTERISIGGQTGLAKFRTEGDNFLQIQQAVAIEWAATDRIGTFLEYATYTDTQSADNGTQHQLGKGFSLLVSDHWQLGFRGGLGLNERAPDLVTSVRLIYRR